MSKEHGDHHSRDAFMQSDALLSIDNMHRLWLSRVWDEELPLMHVIGLNPSTADAYRDDPSVRRIMGFAQDALYGGFILTNLCSLRATHPRVMLAALRCGSYDWESHAANLREIHQVLPRTAIDVAMWGADEAKVVFGDKRLAADVLEMLARAGRTLHALAVTKGGHPRHPLYLKRGYAPRSLTELQLEAMTEA